MAIDKIDMNTGILLSFFLKKFFIQFKVIKTIKDISNDKDTSKGIFMLKRSLGKKTETIRISHKSSVTQKNHYSATPVTNSHVSNFYAIKCQ